MGERVEVLVVLFGLALPFLGCAAPSPAVPAAEADAGGADGSGGEDAPGEEDGAGGEPDACAPVGGAFAAGETVFVEATRRWGLEGVRGAYISVTDIDGDTWPDLIIRDGGGADDFSEGGQRSKWLLRNSGDGSFEDVTQASRIFRSRIVADESYGRPAKVVVSGDVDNDGDLDIFLGHSRTDASNRAVDTSGIMINKGDGTFGQGPFDSAARFADAASNPAGASFVDFDADGNLDLWVVHNELPGLVPMPDTLLRGDGTGAFVDVTAAVGLSTLEWSSVEAINGARAHSWGWGATACDLDSDGLPELMASSYGRTPNHLWRPQREGDAVVFANASVSSGFAYDGRQDWTDDLSAQCFCADNPAAEGCILAPEPDPAVCEALRRAFGASYRWSDGVGREPFQLGGVTGTTVCADVDNDGDLDLVNYEIVHSDTGSASDPTEVLINSGETQLRFDRPGADVTGIRPREPGFWDHGDMTGAVFDFDNDSRLDVYVGAAEYAGNRGLLYHQGPGLVFTEVATDDFFEHWRAHGVAVADFDRDGDLDMVVGHSRFRCEGFEGTECRPTTEVTFYENVLGDRNHWLQVSLDRSAGAIAGARVEVRSGDWVQVQEVDGGHGRNAMQRDPILHFGLGARCRAEVSVRWPDGAESRRELDEVDAVVEVSRP